MRKIGLKLDTLSVESFETAPARVGTGTVQGHQASTRPGCIFPTEYVSCQVDHTDPASCDYGCGCTEGANLC